MQLQIAAISSVPCCHLANTNEKRFRVLPHYFSPCLISSYLYAREWTSDEGTVLESVTSACPNHHHQFLAHVWFSRTLELNRLGARVFGSAAFAMLADARVPAAVLHLVLFDAFAFAVLNAAWNARTPRASALPVSTTSAAAAAAIRLHKTRLWIGSKPAFQGQGKGH